jgi:hypothetical protein
MHHAPFHGMLDPEEEQLQSSVNFRQVVYSNSKDEFVLAMLEPEMEPVCCQRGESDSYRTNLFR